MDKCSKCGCAVDLSMAYYDSMGNILCDHCHDGDEQQDDIDRAWQVLGYLQVYSA